jgi:hypothetical protein
VKDILLKDVMVSWVYFTPTRNDVEYIVEECSLSISSGEDCDFIPGYETILDLMLAGF